MPQLTPQESALVTALLEREIETGPLGEDDNEWPEYLKELKRLQSKLAG